MSPSGPTACYKPNEWLKLMSHHVGTKRSPEVHKFVNPEVASS